MGRAFAAAAVIMFGLSPVALYYHRAVLLDNIAIAWALAAFVLALTPRRRLWAFAGSGACFAAAALSKETISCCCRRCSSPPPGMPISAHVATA